jgi:undecaprenyl-diphosphatase
MSYLHAVILAIIEGFTEFLPISSTGHMIVASSLMKINELEFTKDYTVIVQFGAILAVVVLYWRKFFAKPDQKLLRFYLKLFVAFLPAAVIGLATMKYIEALLGSVVTVAVSFIVGGIILLFVDKWFARTESSSIELNDITFKNALLIGLFQCLALCPGVSRSAATIVGALTQNMSRKIAAEFSFFLAVPTLTAATLYKVYKMFKGHHLLESSNISILVVGNIIAFVVGMITIQRFIGYLTRHGFKFFGYYRIAMGILILVLLALGQNMTDV